MIDQSWLQPKSPTEVQAILAQLRSRLEEVYGPRLRGLYLYGSYARGAAAPGSDHDLTISRAFVSEQQWQQAEEFVCHPAIPHAGMMNAAETHERLVGALALNATPREATRH